MSRDLTQLLFRPRSVVVYGASADPDKLSGRPLDYLLRFNYPGEVFAVNPRRETVQGVRAFTTIADVPGPVDLAIVVVPAGAVVDALRACAAEDVGAAIVFASGFGEVDDDGRALEHELSDISSRSGMRIVGPNCLGTFSVPDNTYATFSTAFDDEAASADSPIGLVTQSGAVGTFTFSAMNALGIGVRFFANTGNSADVTVTETLRALVDEPRVDVLMGHLEDGQDADDVTELAIAAAQAGKSLVLLKSGRTDAGARAIGFHTGSLPGAPQAIENAVRLNGGMCVHGLEDWSDVAMAAVSGRKPRGRRLTMVTLSGGCAAIGADAAVEAGLAVDPWVSQSDRDRIAERLPAFASVRNPIDMTGAMLTDVESLEETLEIVCANDETDSICVVLGNADRNAEAVVANLLKAYNGTDKPFLVSWTGGSGRPRGSLLAAGIPTYTDPGRAVRALARLTTAAAVQRTHTPV